MVSGATDLIEWAASGRPIRGETQSGDLHVVAPFPGGVVLGVIDGLGHGPEAAAVARTAADTIMHRPELPVEDLVEACHGALKGTRGVVLTLASINAAGGFLTWIGVGNVDAVLFGSAERREHALLRGGVVGYRLPPLRPGTADIAAGDVLVFASDGLSHGFADHAPAGSPADDAAILLETFGKTTDDALVLVARYGGLPK